MNSINNITESALKAFGTSQQVTAHNLANLNTDSFKASKVTLQENGSYGVNAAVSGTDDQVDISREAINLMTNTHGFKANLKVLTAAAEMAKELLNIKA